MKWAINNRRTAQLVSYTLTDQPANRNNDQCSCLRRSPSLTLWYPFHVGWPSHMCSPGALGATVSIQSINQKSSEMTFFCRAKAPPSFSPTSHLHRRYFASYWIWSALTLRIEISTNWRNEKRKRTLSIIILVEWSIQLVRIKTYVAQIVHIHGFWWSGFCEFRVYWKKSDER